MKRYPFLLATAAFFAVTGFGQAQPVFIAQPQSQSVSLGVDVVLYAPAYGAGPVSYQWRKNAVDLPEATLELLILSPLQPTDVGDYDVIATDFTGSVTSEVATIAIDPSFIKVTTGPIISGNGAARGGAWGDYNNDGWLDLFVAYDGDLNNALFRNNGNGTFTPVTDSPVVLDGGYSYGGGWADLNNDGFLDLYVANYNAQNDLLYLGSAAGLFTKITSGPVVSDAGTTFGGAWADVDNDGWVDLFAANLFTFGTGGFFPGTNYLYHNNQDGTFSALPNAPGMDETGFPPPFWTMPTWADFDSDGRIDLLLSRFNGSPNSLYRNLGSNRFEPVTSGPIAVEPADSSCAAWGDYDNDGWIDLFVINGFNGGSMPSPLYHNNGNGAFAAVTNGVIASHLAASIAGAWGDYDNDGFLDLFVANLDQDNTLYHNLGDGSFEAMATGSLVHDGGVSIGCSWGDYNNDGFLDLFVANDDQGNFLYQNAGNGNAWLKIQCVGRSSNRAGLGAKARVLAEIRGTNRWQLREITGGATFASQPLLAYFGLGQAEEAITLRVEWPSGLAQEMNHVPARQSLILHEPAYAVLPVNPGAVAGVDFLLSLVGPDLDGQSIQWRFNGEDIAGATNATLLLSQVQSNHLGAYSAMVRAPDRGETVVTAPVVLGWAVPPRTTLHPLPANQSVSLGVNIIYQAAAVGSGPLCYQWYLNGQTVPGGTNNTLSLTNVEVAHAGNYLLITTNLGGATTSRVAALQVDPSFVKIIAGSVVSDSGSTAGSAWLDLCTGPCPALFVTHYGDLPSYLYRNHGDGTLSRVLSSDPILSDVAAMLGVALGDYDNDGRTDVFVANFSNSGNFLYHNECNEVFSRVSGPGSPADPGRSSSGAWADYDHDGWLDLFVANAGEDFLFRNRGAGGFGAISNSGLTSAGGNSRSAAWADYDQDGYPDLVVANQGGANFLFHNNKDGTFTKVAGNPIASDTGGLGCAWGDYDNDGYLDLFVARSGADLLYHNSGNGSFTKVTGVSVVTAGGSSYAAGWADYDNDGWLDLYVANTTVDFLFRNNGDGSFTRIATGSIVNDDTISRGCGWGDYDNDGFPDLFIAKFEVPNTLYRNAANGNHWLKVKCEGIASNRSAIGARVRVQAVLAGTSRWQMREISSGDGFGSQNSIAMFGLGDATNVSTLRVEWPSGLSQEWHDLAPDQFLTLTESLPCPQLQGPRMVQGQFQFQLLGQPGSSSTILASTNLQDWTPWLTVSNETGRATIVPPAPANLRRLYFRATEP